MEQSTCFLEKLLFFISLQLVMYRMPYTPYFDNYQLSLVIFFQKKSPWKYFFFKFSFVYQLIAILTHVLKISFSHVP